MTENEVDGFVRQGRILVLVTLGPDGMPDPVPMWYVPEEGTSAPLMRTFTKSQKVVNLRRDPRASVLIEAGERYAELRGVQMTGHVEIETEPDLIAEVVSGLAAKYEGVAAEHLPAVREAARQRASKQVALRFVADRVVSWDHRKLAPPREVP